MSTSRKGFSASIGSPAGPYRFITLDDVTKRKKDIDEALKAVAERRNAKHSVVRAIDESRARIIASDAAQLERPVLSPSLLQPPSGRLTSVDPRAHASDGRSESYSAGGVGGSASEASQPLDGYRRSDPATDPLVRTHVLLHESEAARIEATEMLTVRRALEDRILKETLEVESVKEQLARTAAALAHAKAELAAKDAEVVDLRSQLQNMMRLTSELLRITEAQGLAPASLARSYDLSGAASGADPCFDAGPALDPKAKSFLSTLAEESIAQTQYAAINTDVLTALASSTSTLAMGGAQRVGGAPGSKMSQDSGGEQAATGRGRDARLSVIRPQDDKDVAPPTAASGSEEGEFAQLLSRLDTWAQNQEAALALLS